MLSYFNIKNFISCEATKEQIHKDCNLYFSVCGCWCMCVCSRFVAHFPLNRCEDQPCQQEPGWFISFSSLHAREQCFTPEVLTLWPTSPWWRASEASLKIAKGRMYRYFPWWVRWPPALLLGSGAGCIKKVRGLYPNKTLFESQVLQCSSCVQLGRLFNCCEHRFFHLENAVNSYLLCKYLILVINEKPWHTQCVVHRKHLIYGSCSYRWHCLWPPC